MDNTVTVTYEDLSKYKPIVKYMLIDKLGDNGIVEYTDLDVRDIKKCIKKINKNIKLYKKFNLI